jgi:FKBP-type peptidyl-prolyl cis-trans isomerase FklB
MKTLRLVALTGLVICLQPALAADDKPVLKDQKEKASYSIGMNIGSGMKMQGIDIDVDLLVKGLRDAYSGGATLLTQQEMQETYRAWQMEMRNKFMEKQKAAGDENTKKGEAFLAENAKKPGVITLPSGLQYKVLASGSGKTPTSNDVVKAHYRGTLIDGTEFDSSYTTGQPLVRPVTGLIKGWTEALLKMKVGDKWQLFIPSSLAYGDRPMGQKIGPNSVLIFEMELLGVEENKAPAVKAGTPEIKLQPR